jgi:aryl-alcohol dehydrogenase-like predicted oxidoreductase
MNFGRRTTPEESYPIIDRALDAGLNFLDTANVYDRGGSEEITGEALKRNGKRSGIIEAQRQAQPSSSGDKGPRQDG